MKLDTNFYTVYSLKDGKFLYGVGREVRTWDIPVHRAIEETPEKAEVYRQQLLNKYNLQKVHAERMIKTAIGLSSTTTYWKSEISKIENQKKNAQTDFVVVVLTVSLPVIAEIGLDEINSAIAAHLQK